MEPLNYSFYWLAESPRDFSCISHVFYFYYCEVQFKYHCTGYEFMLFFRVRIRNKEFLFFRYFYSKKDWVSGFGTSWARWMYPEICKYVTLLRKTLHWSGPRSNSWVLQICWKKWWKLTAEWKIYRDPASSTIICLQQSFTFPFLRKFSSSNFYTKLAGHNLLK